jgi:hypothetical protein
LRRLSKPCRGACLGKQSRSPVAFDWSQYRNGERVYETHRPAPLRKAPSRPHRTGPGSSPPAPPQATSASCLRVPHIAQRSAERVPTSPQCRTCAFSSTQDLHAHEDSRVPQPLRPMIEVTASTSSISIGDLLQVKASYARLSSRAPPSLWHSEEHLESQLNSLRLSHYPRFSHCREPSPSINRDIVADAWRITFAARGNAKKLECLAVTDHDLLVYPAILSNFFRLNKRAFAVRNDESRSNVRVTEV